MHKAPLSFTELNKRIDALPTYSGYSDPLTTRRSRWGFGLGVLGGGGALLCAKLLPNDHAYTAILVLIFGIVEIVGVVLILMGNLLHTLPTPTREFRDIAADLDESMPHYQSLLAWLRSYPREQLESLNEYAQHRNTRMQEKMPLLTGGAEKLGILPLIGALYLQFKDLHWPPHPSWLEILLAAFLVMFYLAGMLRAIVRIRLQLYATLLAKALETKDTSSVMPLVDGTSTADDARVAASADRRVLPDDLS